MGEREEKKTRKMGSGSSWRASERRARQWGALIGCTRDGGPQCASKAKSNLSDTTLRSRKDGSSARRPLCWACAGHGHALCFIWAGFHTVSGRVLLVEAGCLLSWAVWWWTERLHIDD